jgi:hypothetical protein
MSVLRRADWSPEKGKVQPLSCFQPKEEVPKMWCLWLPLLYGGFLEIWQFLPQRLLDGFLKSHLTVFPSSLKLPYLERVAL